MATPLSDEIRALITYANEKTQAGDTTLGGAVKTLCDGFGGGGNVPSSPFPVPRGPLSARLAALLTYANETTGAGDTSIGDAVRTLVDGYGAGSKELVFYDKLISDGTAYIATDYIPGANFKRLNLDFVGLTQFNDILGTRNYLTSNNAFAITVGSLNRTATYSIFSRNNVNYNYGVLAELGWNVLIEESGANYNVSTTRVGGSPSPRTVAKATNYPSNPLYVFGINNGASVTPSYAGTIIRGLEIEDGDRKIHLVPCTYGGEPGMWDTISERFYGNANPAGGAFTAEND